jgi:hypothetical protein
MSGSDLGGAENSLLHVFLKNKCRPYGNEVTHTYITGGKFYVRDSEIGEFYEKYAQDFKILKGLPPVCELHTVYFPMYVDLDLVCNLEYLSDETLDQIIATLNRQLGKFYASAPPFYAIVCTKAYATETEKGWKHGIHVHWPKVIVRVEDAYHIRDGMVTGLEQQKWETLDVDWEEVVDEQVYRSGLRLLGAPKAKPCKLCTPADLACTVCSGKGGLANRHIFDWCVYQFSHVMRGDTRDEEMGEFFRKNTKDLLVETSVRCRQKELTPGFKFYQGFSQRPERGKKRKAIDDAKLTKRWVHLNDSNLHALLREQLLVHSPNYKDARMSVRYDGKEIRVLLSGDGARFCLNKGEGKKEGDYHTSSNVYMVVTKCPRMGYKSAMKCWSAKKVKRPDKPFCCNFVSGARRMDTGKIFNAVAACMACPK